MKKACSPKFNVFNRQRKTPVPLGRLQHFLEKLARRLLGDSDSVVFSVALVGKRRMRELNKKYRNRNYATDVLSFPAGGGDYLGDVVICTEIAREQARGSLLNELQVLSLHGLLHLLGYDHEVDQGEMDHLESALRREFKLH